MKFCFCFLAYLWTACACALAQVETTFYVTYGFQQGGDWIIPVIAWVHKPHTRTEAALRFVAERRWGDRPQELNNFMARARDIIADDQEKVPVKLVFEKDPDSKAYEIKDSDGNLQVTDHDGYVTGRVSLPEVKAKELLTLQKTGTTEGWLTYHAAAGNDSEPGRVRLIGPEGTSVISDIDDTIKVTEIPAGVQVIIKNTLLRPYVAADGMADMYHKWEDEGAAFHYVSAGPWQLYRPLAQFRNDNKFPEGSFHMRVINLGISHMRDLESFVNLILDKQATFNHKVSRITELMERFPNRKFVFVGDSGEKDPEVYDAVRKGKYRERVSDIFIRDVVRPMGGMKIIQGGISKHGVSQFDGVSSSP